MTLKDMHNNIKQVVGLWPQLVTETAEGTPGDDGVADLKGFHAAECVFMLGEEGGTETWSDTVKIKLEIHESDAATSGFAAAASASLIGEVAEIEVKTNAEKECFTIGYKGTKRYIKPVFKLTGTFTDGTYMSSATILGLPQKASTR